MPKKLTKELPSKIIDEISRYLEGIAIDSLFEVVKELASRRTLQRRLRELVENGMISGIGVMWMAR